MNHMFATSKAVLNPAKLRQALLEISLNRFGSSYVVSWELPFNVQYPACYGAGRGYYGFSCWLNTKRTIEFSPNQGNFAAWVTTVFQTELATKFKGNCSDEGEAQLPGRPYPPQPITTYKTWWDHANECWVINDEYKALASKMWNETKTYIPDPLQKFCGVLND